MITCKTIGLIFISGSLSLSLITTIAEAQKEPAKKVLLEQTVELPDKKVNVKVRTIRWPVGYKTKPHTHSGPGPRYVLSGKVEIDDQGKVGQYSAGESFWHLGGFPHTAENIHDDETEVLIIELLPIK